MAIVVEPISFRGIPTHNPVAYPLQITIGDNLRISFCPKLPLHLMQPSYITYWAFLDNCRDAIVCSLLQAAVAKRLAIRPLQGA
jgi:hypothetical protein